MPAKVLQKEIMKSVLRRFSELDIWSPNTNRFSGFGFDYAFYVISQNQNFHIMHRVLVSKIRL